MLQATGHPFEIPGILPAISAGYRGTVLVVKGVWLVMIPVIIVSFEKAMYQDAF